MTYERVRLSDGDNLWCNSHGAMEPSTDFYRDKRTFDGYAASCKQAASESRAKVREKRRIAERLAVLREMSTQADQDPVDGNRVIITACPKCKHVLQITINGLEGGEYE